MNTTDTIVPRRGAVAISVLLPLLSLLSGPSAGAQEVAPKRKVMRMMQPPQPRLDFVGPEASFPLDTWHGRPVLEVKINDQGPFAFILDTGATGALVDSGLAKELGLPVVGQARVGSPANDETVTVDLVSLSRAEAAGAVFHEMECSTSDLAGLFGDDGAPRGVFSVAAFGGLLVTFDYPARKLVVRRGALPDPDGVTSFGYQPGERLPTVEIDLAGHRVRAHIDTGMPGGIGLPLAMADELKLASAPQPVGSARTPAGELTIYGAQLEGSVVIGPLELENPMINFSEGGVQDVGRVGARVLGRLVLTIDPAQHRLRLESPPGSQEH